MLTSPKTKIIWITWENQRRTEELSKALGVRLYKIVYKGNYLLRFILSSINTVMVLIAIRPNKVIVQNPSIMLTVLVCFLKNFFRYKVITDRHSNFKFSSLNSPKLTHRIFHYLSKYTLKKSDLTIITNASLEKIVNDWGARGFVLQDKLPDLGFKKLIKLKGRFNLAYISSFSSDEPIEEVISAARLLNPEIHIYITGNHKKADKNIINNAPPNVIFTGFLDERDYQSLIYSADILMALTTQEHTLLCSAYEAVAVSKPLIISNKNDLKNYFYKGAVPTENNFKAIFEAINSAIANQQRLRKEVKELSSELNKAWKIRFDNLISALSSL